MGARFITGQRTTVYKNYRKRKVFESDRPGRCPICTQTFPVGEMVMWAPKYRLGRKDFLPAHKACVEYEHVSRTNIRTKDGGYDVQPSTPTRDQRAAVTSRNRKIDRTAQFG